MYNGIILFISAARHVHFGYVLFCNNEGHGDVITSRESGVS